jgi:anti-sigma factor RsiW
MTTCLSDRALYALSEHDATPAERAHVAACERCARRVRHLTRDLDVIGEALRAPAPAYAPRPAVARLPWRIAAAAAVVAVVAVVISAPRVFRLRAGDGDGVAAFAALSQSVFAQDADATPTSDVDVLAAAFDSAGPCEWQPEGCDDDE